MTKETNLSVLFSKKADTRQLDLGMRLYILQLLSKQWFSESRIKLAAKNESGGLGRGTLLQLNEGQLSCI